MGVVIDNEEVAVMSDKSVPETNGGRLLKRGDTFDPECWRTTHRLRVAGGILSGLGITATYVEHDEKCIRHPDNRGNRVFGHSYHCDPGCPRGTYDGEKPVWPEWATGRMFDLAYRLADEVQTERGGWHQREASRAKAAREAAARGA